MADTLYEAEFILTDEMIDRSNGPAKLRVDPIATGGSAHTEDGCIAVVLESEDLEELHPSMSRSISKRIHILVTVEDVSQEGDE